MNNGYCNILKRNRSRGDAWLFKINVFKMRHLMEWPYCFCDNLQLASASWSDKDAFKAIAPISPLSVNVDVLESVSIACLISCCVDFTAVAFSLSPSFLSPPFH